MASDRASSSSTNARRSRRTPQPRKQSKVARRNAASEEAETTATAAATRTTARGKNGTTRRRTKHQQTPAAQPPSLPPPFISTEESDVNFFGESSSSSSDEEERAAAAATAVTNGAGSATLDGTVAITTTTDASPTTPLVDENGDILPPPAPLLTELPAQKRWRDFSTRFVWTLIMFIGQITILLSGVLPVIMMILGIQTMIFKEVIALAHVPSKEKKLPWFRLINWYFLIVSTFFFYGETLFTHFHHSVLIDAFFHPLATHHRFSSYVAYVVGLVFFVMNLKKGHYKFQFLQFFWTHMTLLVVVFQAQFVIANALSGLIWFVLPAYLVIVNDIFAYVGGFFFGRTRLIKLSPKKTWEGFVVGFVCTLAFSVVAARWLSQYEYMTCPMQDLTLTFWRQQEIQCEPHPVFVPVKYRLPPALAALLGHLTRSATGSMTHITVAPIQFHALVMACFASSIAPFGGFFASGFKRAFKIKDFAQSIPGHGGVTDRMDCQLLMAFFTYMYYTTFIKQYEVYTVSSLLEMIVTGLGPEDQLRLYGDLREYLVGQALLGGGGGIVGVE